MKTVSYSLTYKLNSALILLLTFFASFYCFLTANLYAAKYIPVSFPYRDTGTIRESYRNDNAKTQEAKSKQELFIGVKLNPLFCSISNFPQAISRHTNNIPEYELII